MIRQYWYRSYALLAVGSALFSLHCGTPAEGLRTEGSGSEATTARNEDSTASERLGAQGHAAGFQPSIASGSSANGQGGADGYGSEGARSGGAGSSTATDERTEAGRGDGRRAPALDDRSASGGAAGSGAASEVDGGTSPDDLQFCVDENNRLRATLGMDALQRNARLEDYATQGAKYDDNAETAHQHFKNAPLPRGALAMGENEIPGFSGWSLEKQGSVHSIIEQGIQMMWKEGPGGGHYDNMTSRTFTDIGCGIYAASNGAVTVTIDFAKF